MSFKFIGLAMAMTLSVAQAQAETQNNLAPCSGADNQIEVINLARATRLALEADRRPELAKAEIRAARAERAIAALRPADTVSLDVEDFPGTGLASNIDNLQITGRFSRVWERGGKQDARIALAESGVGVAEAIFRAANFEIRSEIETLYAEAALAQRRVELACDEVEISIELERSIKKRVDAARDPLLAGARAKSQRLQAEAEVRHFDARAQAVREALGAYWQRNRDFQINPKYLTTRPPSQSVFYTEVYSPVFDRLDAERRQTVAQIDLERTKAVPDVTWNVGVRKFGYQEDLAIIGGVSIPLGTKKRSRASVAKVYAEQRRIKVARQTHQQGLLRKAAGYSREAQNAAEEISQIDNRLIPAAMEAVELAQEGYDRGAFSYLDIVDAQRSIAALREERLTHLRTYILNTTALERLSPSMGSETLPEETQ
ncbi:TolC family protein [Litorimonas sp.]|uniref:TolC family protein n=1 Tax=Litorimonas sp. TaxID=1892381 RepID=UPI003A8602D0